MKIILKLTKYSAGWLWSFETKDHKIEGRGFQPDANVAQSAGRRVAKRYKHTIKDLDISVA